MSSINNKLQIVTGLSSQELLSVQKPAQYLGGECNEIQKESAEVHLALAFPDTYEVGMSHLGLQILYSVANKLPYAWAERVFMPQSDMEEILREKNLPLVSLESSRKLSEFDVLGFSLQYELCGTNILSMLELGGIPLRAADRDDSHPLVVGGGPYSYHPEALADFFDFFFLGDAEEGLVEILELVRTKSGASRKDILAELSGSEGIYIPSEFSMSYKEDGILDKIQHCSGEDVTVRRKLLPTLEGAPYADKPLVPNIETIHNRLSIEVMRGCVRGCRFCQAGYLYRPQRERPPQEIFEMVKNTLPDTGFEELSLLSLSTADYCSVVPLLKQLMDEYASEDQLAISFPSTRVDSLTPEVLEQVRRVRRTNFTVAPEAGTQRLRDVINKGVSDEQILETANNVFSMGWTGIKLYFMLGLPTETDEDLEGIVSIASRIKALPSARGKKITVSVSTHVPKPHTPFQWSEQISPEETLRKQRFLAGRLSRVKVNFRYHQAFSTFLEGVFCRADRSLSYAIERAYKLGCRLDAWTEHLDEELWMQAFSELGINPHAYLRERALDETLPWDHLSCDIPKSYFLKEYRRALRDKATPDCLTQSCSVCGACDYDEQRNVLWPRDETEAKLVSKQETPEEKSARYIYRVKFSKFEPFSYVGHLELVNVLARAIRRANLPLAFTQGFHPHPKLSFGNPLQLGVESREEYCDISFFRHLEVDKLITEINSKLPEGLFIISAEILEGKNPSLGAVSIAADYTATLLAGEVKSLNLEGKEVVRPAKKRGKKEKRISLEPFVQNLNQPEVGKLEFRLLTPSEMVSPKATEVVEKLTGLSMGEYRLEKCATILSEASVPNAENKPSQL